MLVGVGEAAERKVSIGRLGSQDQREMGLDEALVSLKAETVVPEARKQ